VEKEESVYILTGGDGIQIWPLSLLQHPEGKATYFFCGNSDFLSVLFCHYSGWEVQGVS
jgi:hypothetical protein